MNRHETSCRYRSFLVVSERHRTGTPNCHRECGKAKDKTGIAVHFSCAVSVVLSSAARSARRVKDIRGRLARPPRPLLLVGNFAPHPLRAEVLLNSRDHDRELQYVELRRTVSSGTFADAVGASPRAKNTKPLRKRQKPGAGGPVVLWRPRYQD